jgi:hypothetical protein
MILSAVAYGEKATVGSVWTTDSSGNPRDTFNLDEMVYIHWSANGEVDITLSHDVNGLDNRWENQPSSGTIAYVPTQGAGYYTIECTGAPSRTIAVGTFFVIPELAFGTVAALIASFGAFGLVKLKKHRS